MVKGGLIAKARAAMGENDDPDRKLEGFVSTVKVSAHNHSLSKVNKILKEDFELCAHVCYLLETGKLQHKVSAGTLPASCNKWRLLRKEKRDDLVKKLWPNLVADADMFKKASSKDKRICERLLMRGLDVEWSSAIYSKDISELVASCRRRREEVGVTYENAFSADGTFDWVKHGQFDLVASTAGGSYTCIRHRRSGVQHDLADIGHTIDRTWYIGQNYDTRRATLSKGRIHIPIYKMLTKTDKAKAAPEMLQRVPGSTGRSPAKPSGQDSDDDGDDDNDISDSAPSEGEPEAVQVTPMAKRKSTKSPQEPAKRQRLSPPVAGNGSAVDPVSAS